jgi:hypothetical protein
MRQASIGVDLARRMEQPWLIETERGELTRVSSCLDLTLACDP